MSFHSESGKKIGNIDLLGKENTSFTDCSLLSRKESYRRRKPCTKIEFKKHNKNNLLISLKMLMPAQIKLKQFV